MSKSNQALSYLLLRRDRAEFQKKFPQFTLVYQKPFGFIRYMATGGLYLKQKIPTFLFPVLKAMEFLLQPLMGLLALHHVFVLKKTDRAPGKF